MVRWVEGLANLAFLVLACSFCRCVKLVISLGPRGELSRGFAAVGGEAEGCSVANFGWAMSKRRTFFIKSMRSSSPGSEGSTFGGVTLTFQARLIRLLEIAHPLHLLPKRLLLALALNWQGDQGFPEDHCGNKTLPTAKEAVRWRFVLSKTNHVGRW